LRKDLLKPPTELELRVIEAGGRIAGTPVGSDVAFQHAVLCQVGLPRKRVDGDRFERQSGEVSLLVKSGELFLGGKWVPQPVPYGVKPRLALIHLCSEAVRTRSPVVEVGDSVREFLKRLGLGDDGRAYSMFRKQMAALAACEMRLGFRDRTEKLAPVDGFEAWFANDGAQRTLWPGVITLTDKFFDSLAEHAVPLDPRAIVALRHSAMALDLYTWLAHRLWRIRTPVKVPWRALHQQFGAEYAEVRVFRRKVAEALIDVRRVYPDAKVEPAIGGLMLKASPPPVPKTTFGFRRAPLIKSP
jgi:hypothetical protein